MLYQGKFIPKNLNKYDGNHSNIYYRSSWELRVMMWLDSAENVVKWASETVIVPYISPFDQKVHRYFVDFKITFKSGRTLLVELKPEKQTMPPKPRKKKKKLTEAYLMDLMTYETNQAKWKSARQYATMRDWDFKVWTEKTLNSMGILLITK